jgi:23S rRNA pseudouridine2604 synthase
MQFRYHLSYQLTKITRCSHKQALDFCKNGLVQIDGMKETNPRRIIGQKEEIKIRDEIVREGLTFRYVLFYKPNLYECTSNRLIENNIYEVLPECFHDLFSFGRLDKNSEGLLLLSNDGQAYKDLMDKESEVEKEYLVHTFQPIIKSLRTSFTEPFLLGQRFTKPALFEQLDEFSFRVVLKEGINRHIRRICAKNENQVKQLIRIRIGNHLLGNLGIGEWKEVNGF